MDARFNSHAACTCPHGWGSLRQRDRTCPRHGDVIRSVSPITTVPRHPLHGFPKCDYASGGLIAVLPNKTVSVTPLSSRDYRDVAELARLRTALRDCRDAATDAAEKYAKGKRKPAGDAAAFVSQRARRALRENA